MLREIVVSTMSSLKYILKLYAFHSGHGVGNNSFKDLIDFILLKIIQESDPSLWWVLTNVYLRPEQNKKGWMWML